VTVNSVTRRVEQEGHKLYVNNFLPSPAYLMIWTQEVSNVVGLSDKTVKECHWALTIRN